jgi:hypothetical protein
MAWQNCGCVLINGSLIDFTDFLPTLAGVANNPVPRYGILDGRSFYPQLKGKQGQSTQLHIYTF